MQSKKICLLPISPVRSTPIVPKGGSGPSDEIPHYSVNPFTPRTINPPLTTKVPRVETWLSASPFNSLTLCSANSLRRPAISTSRLNRSHSLRPLRFFHSRSSICRRNRSASSCSRPSFASSIKGSAFCPPSTSLGRLAMAGWMVGAADMRGGRESAPIPALGPEGGRPEPGTSGGRRPARGPGRSAASGMSSTTASHGSSLGERPARTGRRDASIRVERFSGVETLATTSCAVRRHSASAPNATSSSSPTASKTSVKPSSEPTTSEPPTTTGTPEFTATRRGRHTGRRPAVPGWPTRRSTGSRRGDIIRPIRHDGEEALEILQQRGKAPGRRRGRERVVVCSVCRREKVASKRNPFPVRNRYPCDGDRRAGRLQSTFLGSILSFLASGDRECSRIWTISPSRRRTDRSRRRRIIIISPPRSRRRAYQPLPLRRGRRPSTSTTTPKRRRFPPPLQRQRTTIPIPRGRRQMRGRRPTCKRTTAGSPTMKIPLISIIAREFFTPDSRRARPASSASVTAAGSHPSEAAGSGSGVECGRCRRRSRHGGAAEASVRSGRNRYAVVGENVRGRRLVGRTVRLLGRIDLGNRVRGVSTD
ncbi:hypothetical protein KC356_g355 [Hortaea werneckii]|nr:hypothetical protein KC356_g355 [Hortaea werneckii]